MLLSDWYDETMLLFLSNKSRIVSKQKPLIKYLTQLLAYLVFSLLWTLEYFNAYLLLNV